MNSRPEIYADFNARDPEGSVWLHTTGSVASLHASGAQPGDWVWLSDGELRVLALLTQREQGRLAAVPAWSTVVIIHPA